VDLLILAFAGTPALFISDQASADLINPEFLPGSEPASDSEGESSVAMNAPVGGANLQVVEAVRGRLSWPDAVLPVTPRAM